jgi:hypothetical protein
VNHLFIECSHAAIEFQLKLTQYNVIVAPLAQAIKSLESTQTTAPNVYISWLAIIATLKELFDKGELDTGISRSLATKITTIINCRYCVFIDKSLSDIYFAAFFLDPRE